jgi:transcriptional regulator with GAF, ATPase, and Fis domain
MTDGRTGRVETRPPAEEPREQPLARLSDVERRHIERVLDEVRWNQRRAARILGITRWSLARRLRKYAMHRSAPASAQHA